MAVRSRTLAFAAALSLAAAGTAVDAQFSNPLKKLGSKPARPDAPPSDNRVVQCGEITEKDIDDLLARLEADRARRAADAARREAADQQQRATQHAIDQASAERMMAAMAKQEACEQAAIDKDPRSREAERIGEQRNRALDRGDEAAADRLGEQFAELTDAIEKAAKAKCLDPACLARARQESPIRKQIEEMRAAAAKSGNAQQRAMIESQLPAYEGMVEIEALQKCGPAGAGALTADEQAQTDRAAEAAYRARQGRDDPSDGNNNKKDDGRVLDCACGGLGDGNGVALSDQSRQVIERRRAELTPALKASTNCRGI